jgi:N6-L-threonylcarbamoyladenine synthase
LGQVVLGIESSCDETAIAVLKEGKVLSSLIASQTSTHAIFGGVVPEIAAREHLGILPSLFRKALSDAQITLDDVDFIAVTNGPGLIGSLLVGSTFAKGLSLSTGKPILPVNHVHAHIFGALLGTSATFENIQPIIALVVSGGHTNLYLMRQPNDLQLLSYTLDDACGESFDKVGKLLGLPYPGGPHVESLAKTGNSNVLKLPVPSGSHFSYSGLKTAVLQQVQKKIHRHADIAAAFQEAALDQIVRSIEDAMRRFPEAKSILIAGGVAANQTLRQKLSTRCANKELLFPRLEFCSDNAAMVANYAYHLAASGAMKPSTSLDWDVYSRYPFENFAVN